MTRKITITLGIVAALVLASAVVRVGVLAQGPGGAPDTHGVPVVQKEPPTMPEVKVTKRVYDKKALLASHPDAPEDVQTGRALYQQKCAYCHDGVGQPSYKTMGDWIGGETVQSLGADAFKAFVNTGTTRMPGFQYNLNSKQMDDLIAFIKTIPSSDKPTQNQLDGKAPPLDSND